MARRYAPYVDAARQDRLTDAAEWLAEQFSRFDPYGFSREGLALDALQDGALSQWSITPEELDEVLSLARQRANLQARQQARQPKRWQDMIGQRAP